MEASLDALRDEEGSYVTLYNDNPGGAPSALIYACGPWTGGTPRRFEGESVGDALAAAAAAKEKGGGDA